MQEFFWIFSSMSLFYRLFSLTSYLRALRVLAPTREYVMRRFGVEKSCHVSSNKFLGSQKSPRKPNPHYQWVILRKTTWNQQVVMTFPTRWNFLQENLKKGSTDEIGWRWRKAIPRLAFEASVGGGNGGRRPSTNLLFDFSSSSATHPRF